MTNCDEISIQYALFCYCRFISLFKPKVQTTNNWRRTWNQFRFCYFSSHLRLHIRILYAFFWFLCALFSFVLKEIRTHFEASSVNWFNDVWFVYPRNFFHWHQKTDCFRLMHIRSYFIDIFWFGFFFSLCKTDDTVEVFVIIAIFIFCFSLDIFWYIVFDDETVD